MRLVATLHLPFVSAVSSPSYGTSRLLKVKRVQGARKRFVLVHCFRAGIVTSLQ